VRADSIQVKGLEKHVNEYAVKHAIPWRYRHLVDWLERGADGQPVSKEWIRRQFAPLSRHAFKNWIAAYYNGKS
jgi:hypothetical protein